MREFFYEEAVGLEDEAKGKKKYLTFKIMSIICFVLIPVSFLLGYVFYLSNEAVFGSSFWLLVSISPVIIFFFLGFMFSSMKMKFIVEYDYTLVTGEIYISKIYNNSKRLRVMQFFCSDVQTVGKVDGDSFKRITSAPKTKVFYHLPDKKETKDAVFFSIKIAGETHVVVMKASNKFLVNTTQFISRKTFENGVL